MQQGFQIAVVSLEVLRVRILPLLQTTGSILMGIKVPERARDCKLAL